MKRASLLVVMLVMLSTIAHAENREVVDWVMYLIVRPHNFYRAAYGNDAIEKYDFPLYAGYVYSEDSKSIKWHAVESVFEDRMRRWSKTYSEYDLVSMHPIDASNKMGWKLSEHDFFEAATILITEQEGFYPVRYEKNATIDPDWRPIFSGKFRYSKEDADKFRIAPMPKKDFTPLNWDQGAYNERMKK